jgi:hypothetical protein
MRLSDGSRLDLGLEEAAGALEVAYPAEAKILILVTDGLPSVEPARVIAQADLARQAGARIYAIGVGDEIDRQLLGRLTGSADRVYASLDAEGLSSLVRAISDRESCSP